MARPISEHRPLTPLGKALEKARVDARLTRAQAIDLAQSSRKQWSCFLHERREFAVVPVVRAANAVGLDPAKALELIGCAVVPDSTTRTVTISELLQLQMAG